jgi:hypothetical protein
VFGGEQQVANCSPNSQHGTFDAQHSKFPHGVVPLMHSHVQVVTFGKRRPKQSRQ